MNVIVSKFKEVLFSVLPITVMVLILNFTISPMETPLIIRFLIGSLFVVLGLTIFLLGIDIGITPLGNLTGSSLAKSNKLWIVLIGGLILGFFISIAEPGLMVLANQVDLVTSGQIPSISILVIVSIGLAILLALGFLRVFYNVPLYKILIILYLIIFGLSIFTSREFLAISFDASGSTTGILAVPFILSLSVGISKLKKDSKASEKDSFGLVAIASTGAIISVMILDIFTKTYEFSATLDSSISDSDSIISSFVRIIPDNLKDSFMAILPLLVILLVLQKVTFKLSKRDLRKLLTGFGFSFVGLFIFFLGVNAGFMDVGTSIGNNLVLLDNKAYIIIIGFILGVVTILAEPAVYVLTHQIEDITSGYVKRKVVLVPLAIGVGLAVALSVIRVLVLEINLWHYLLPGYFICILLMFFTPKLFVGIAFDAGGVATGPMTATFILAFIQGAANAFEGADLMVDGFGMIAMVAMTPILTLEALGLVFALKSKTKGVEKKDD
ncbi:DUF1538 domain-containing protein [Clostridium tetanomorphum]|uniref:DUF1538 domain-containing protein n=1 Tax=Clostridium tetanomorphum TaxID=1553 RepID=A0A923IZL1_CLOTT|nr:DUF1538 domain-containing protein [Clostridium tetanomorphum]MBC2397436.1 DUF1538 domain-containing protein [Clostridium tetanomorphum]NRZ95810.1 hypothetical protein [Clostridium tetanomorphum]